MTGLVTNGVTPNDVGDALGRNGVGVPAKPLVINVVGVRLPATPGVPKFMVAVRVRVG